MTPLERRCSFFPTTKGWYMQTTVCGQTAAEDISGPVASLWEAALLLEDFCSPGVCDVSFSLRAVPEGVASADLAGCKSDLPGAPDYFVEHPKVFNITATTITEGVLLHDTATAVTYVVVDGKITGVAAFEFWIGERRFNLKTPLNLPTSKDGWEALSRGVVAIFLAEGLTYQPVILPGLPRQPLAAAELMEASLIS